MAKIYLGRKYRDGDFKFSEDEVMALAFRNNVENPVWASVSHDRYGVFIFFQLVVWEKGVVFDRRDVFKIDEDDGSFGNWIKIYEEGGELPVYLGDKIKEWVKPIEGEEIDLDIYLSFKERIKGIFESFNSTAVDIKEKKENRGNLVGMNKPGENLFSDLGS